MMDTKEMDYETHIQEVMMALMEEEILEGMINWIRNPYPFVCFGPPVPGSITINGKMLDATYPSPFNNGLTHRSGEIKKRETLGPCIYFLVQEPDGQLSQVRFCDIQEPKPVPCRHQEKEQYNLVKSLKALVSKIFGLA